MMYNIVNLTLVEVENIRREEMELAFNYIKEYHSYRWLYLPSVDCTVWLDPYLFECKGVLRLGVVITGGKTPITNKCVRVVQSGLLKELEELEKILGSGGKECEII